MKHRTSAGLTLLETLVGLATAGFIISGTGILFQALLRQQELARTVVSADEELSDALRTMTRVIRHGIAVVESSSVFGAQATGNDRLVVEVPEPRGAARPTMEIQFHIQDRTLFKRRADQVAPGTPLATGVNALRFQAYRRSADQRVLLPAVVDGEANTWKNADEITISMDLDRGRQRLRQSVTISLRNRALGF